MKAAPTPKPKSFFLFLMRLVIALLVSSPNSVPYFVFDLVVLTLCMIGFRAEKLFVFGGDQDKDRLEDRLEEEEDLLAPDLLEENHEPPPLPHPPPLPPPLPPPPLPPLASTDENMT